MILHLWNEPILVLITALALRFTIHETHISTRLFIASPCMWLKE